jgi:type IV pilus biogenesis protein CpaD/CtpE
MSTRFYTTGAALALLAALAGCAPSTPRWESSFGNAVRATVAAQVADPAAVRNRNPVSGIDGDAAKAAHTRYARSFGTPSVPEPALISGRGK